MHRIKPRIRPDELKAPTTLPSRLPPKPPVSGLKAYDNHQADNAGGCGGTIAK